MQYNTIFKKTRGWTRQFTTENKEKLRETKKNWRSEVKWCDVKWSNAKRHVWLARMDSFSLLACSTNAMHSWARSMSPSSPAFSASTCKYHSQSQAQTQAHKINTIASRKEHFTTSYLSANHKITFPINTTLKHDIFMHLRCIVL